jgi:hypothetical protein
VIERQIGEHTWWIVTRQFATRLAGERAYKSVAKHERGGPLGAGIYRHGPSEDLGRLVTAVSLNRELAERIDRRLKRDGGSELRLDDVTINALILRRARFVTSLGTDAPAGRYRVGHGKGEMLRPDGTFPEKRG